MSGAPIKEELKPGAHVKYRIEEVKGMGMAIVADEDIPKGTLVFVSKIGVNWQRIGNKEDLLRKISTLPDKEAKKKYLEHVFGHKGEAYTQTDDWTYLNHSLDPNIANIGDNVYHDYAIKDIKKGDMFVENYHVHYQNPDWLMEIIIENGVDPDFF